MLWIVIILGAWKVARQPRHDSRIDSFEFTSPLQTQLFVYVCTVLSHPLFLFFSLFLCLFGLIRCYALDRFCKFEIALAKGSLFRSRREFLECNKFRRPLGEMANPLAGLLNAPLPAAPCWNELKPIVKFWRFAISRHGIQIREHSTTSPPSSCRRFYSHIARWTLFSM